MRIKEIINDEIKNSIDSLKKIMLKESFFPVIIIVERVDCKKSTETNIHCTGELTLLGNPSLDSKKRIELLEIALSIEKEKFSKLS